MGRIDKQYWKVKELKYFGIQKEFRNTAPALLVIPADNQIRTPQHPPSSPPPNFRRSLLGPSTTYMSILLPHLHVFSSIMVHHDPLYHLDPV